MQRGHTLVDWLKLGEFLLRSVEPISESGRDTPLPLVGEAVGVLFMRSGDTWAREHQHCRASKALMAREIGGHTASLRDMVLGQRQRQQLSMQAGYLRRRGMFAKNGAAPSRRSRSWYGCALIKYGGGSERRTGRRRCWMGCRGEGEEDVLLKWRL